MPTSSKDVRAGGAFVEIYAKDGALRRTLDGASKRVSTWGKTINSIGNKAGVTGLALGAPVAAFFNSGIDRASQLDDLADAFGTTTEKLSPLAHAFGVAGLGLEDLEKGMKKVAEGDESGRPIEDVFKEWALGLESIEDPGERAREAMDKFGKAGLKVASLAPDLARLMEDAPVIDSDTAKNAEKFQQSFALMKLSIQGALLPGINFISQYAVKLAEIVKNHSEWARGVAAVAAGLIAAGIAMKAIGGGLSLVGLGIKGLSIAIGVVGTLISMVPLLLTPLGLVFGIIAGGVAVWGSLTESGQTFFGKIGRGFKEMVDIAKDSWGGIVAAIAKGDLELAADIAWATIRVGWAGMILFLTESWVQFKSFFVDGWHDAGFAISLIWNDITAGLEMALALTLEAVIDAFNSAITTLASGAAWLLDQVGLEETARDLNNFKGIGTAWIAKWKQEIEKDRQAEENRIGNERNRRMDANERFREEQIAGAKRDFDDAEARRRALVAQAKAEVQKEEEYKPGGPDAAVKPAAFPEAIKGAFTSPNFARALGIGDKVGEKQLQVQKDIKKEVEQLQVMPRVANALEGIFDVVKQPDRGLRFA